MRGSSWDYLEPKAARFTTIEQPMPQRSWYAVHCWSGHESKVHDRLAERNVSDLYPTYETRKRWSDREKRILRPLFPSYLFVEIALSEKVAVLSITGVSQILGGRDPIAVPEFEIQQVKILMSSPQLVAPVVSYQPAVGDQVEVLAGVFAGVTGTVERFKSRPSRISVIVRIPSLLAAATVEVDAQDLRRLEPRRDVRAAA